MQANLVVGVAHRVEVNHQDQAAVAIHRERAREVVPLVQVEVVTLQVRVIHRVRAMVVDPILAMPCAYLP